MTVASAETNEKLWVTEFLQSAVVLDDQGYTLGGGEAVGTLVHPAHAPERRILSETVRTAAEPETKGREPNDLDTKALTDSFASYGVVCGILCPSKTDVEEESERLVKAAQRADIVILDWQVNGDDGAAAKSTIVNLLKAEAIKSALKIVCIYTADTTSLVSIIASVKTAIEENGWHAECDGDYELSVGAMRVALFSKVELKGPDAQLVRRYASEANLPHRVIELFEITVSSMLGRFAIQALSALRNNTHSIAARFSKLLDAGYLWHRAALPDPIDAESHIREILANELESIIEVSGSVSAASAEQCGRVVDALNDPLNVRFAIEETVMREDVRALFTTIEPKGMVKRLRKKLKSENKPAVDIMGFADTVGDATVANEQFAMTMLLKSYYGGTPRRFHLGTVVGFMDAEKPLYFICMQALCDSTRISDSRKFPLLPLQLVDDGRFNLVLPLLDGKIGHFLMSYHPYLLDMREFAVSKEASGAVPVTVNGDKHLVTDTKDVQFQVLAELRPMIAHRIAQKVAHQFGRIGLDVPEWLREKDKD